MTNLPKVAIFDLCGTLINSKAVDHEAINFTLSAFEKPEWRITRNLKNPMMSMKENFPYFFGKRNAPRAYRIYISYLNAKIKKIPFFAGAKEDLELCQLLGIKTAVITNRDASFVKALEKNEEYVKNIKPNLNLVLTADEAGCSKPSVRVVDEALKRLGLKNVKADEIMIVGDALADMKLAIEYGCRPVLLTETTADINSKFLSENEGRIFIADTHYMISDYIKQSSVKKNWFKDIISGNIQR